MNYSSNASEAEVKILINVNKLEKMMRKQRKLLKNMKRPLNKALNKLQLLQNSYEQKKQMFIMFQEQRDKLMVELHLIETTGVK